MIIYRQSCRLAKMELQKSCQLRRSKLRKLFCTLVNGLRQIQQSLMPNTLCGGLDKPDGTCQLPDIFPAMAHKIHGNAREIAQC